MRLHFVLNLIALVAFVLGGIVQYNDPDPAIWIAVYWVAAALCGLEIAGRTPWVAALVLAGVATAWAATLLPFVFTHPPVWSEVFSDVRMMSPGVEETRESLGLLLIAAWMARLALVNRRRQAASKPGA